MTEYVPFSYKEMSNGGVEVTEDFSGQFIATLEGPLAVAQAEILIKHLDNPGVGYSTVDLGNDETAIVDRDHKVIVQVNDGLMVQAIMNRLKGNGPDPEPEEE